MHGKRVIEATDDVIVTAPLSITTLKSSRTLVSAITKQWCLSSSFAQTEMFAQKAGMAEVEQYARGTFWHCMALINIWRTPSDITSQWPKTLSLERSKNGLVPLPTQHRTIWVCGITTPRKSKYPQGMGDWQLGPASGATSLHTYLLEVASCNLAILWRHQNYRFQSSWNPSIPRNSSAVVSTTSPGFR